MIDRIGPFEVVRELGRGGQGAVYEARDPALPRAVAIKVITAGLVDEDDLARFRREAETLAAVNHPGVVRVHGVHELGPGRPYLVLDLVRGAALPGAAPQPARSAAAIVRDVADAVAALHRAGVLHRDLKPSNVLVDERGRPVLIDFGLARRLDASRFTETGTILGTPGSMAPEQAEGRTDLDARVDVYGLGALLFHLLAGRAPFTGQPLPQMLFAVLTREPAWPAAPAGLLAILRRAMAKDRAARQPSAEALRDELDAWLRHGDRPPPARWPAPLAVVLVLVLATIVGVVGLRGPAQGGARPDAPARPPRAPSAGLPARVVDPAPSAPAPAPRPLAVVTYLHDLASGRPLDRHRDQPLWTLKPGSSTSPDDAPVGLAFLGAAGAPPALLVSRAAGPAKGGTELVLWDSALEVAPVPIARAGVRTLARGDASTAFLGVEADVWRATVDAGRVRLDRVSAGPDGVAAVSSVPQVTGLTFEPTRRLLVVLRHGVAHLLDLGGWAPGSSPPAVPLALPSDSPTGAAFVAPDRLVICCAGFPDGSSDNLRGFQLSPGPPVTATVIPSPATTAYQYHALVGVGRGVVANTSVASLLRLEPQPDGAWTATDTTAHLGLVLGERTRLGVEPEGEVVYALSGATVHVLAAAGLVLERGSWTVDPGAQALAVSPDGRFVAIGHADGHVDLWAAGDRPRRR